MSGYSAAAGLVTTMQAALEAADVDAVTTLDPAEAGALLGGEQYIGLVSPPTTTWETWAVQVHAFEVVLISPVQDAMTAWPLLDDLSEALSDPLEIDTARLTLWQPTSGDPWPALILTLDTTTHQE